MVCQRFNLEAPRVTRIDCVLVGVPAVESLDLRQRRNVELIVIRALLSLSVHDSDALMCVGTHSALYDNASL